MRSARGLTLIEIVSAIAILAIAAAVGFGAMTSSLPQALEVGRTIVARELARDLLEEVLSKSFDDPSPPDGESFRGSFDDVDDYNGYSEHPPVDPNGVPIPGAGAFTRGARVFPVDPLQPNTPVPTSALKRIEVEVSWGSGSMVTLVGLRARESPDVLPYPRSGLVYVDGSRPPGNRETLRVQIVNRTGRAIAVVALRAYWLPPLEPDMHYRAVELGGEVVWQANPTYAGWGEEVQFSRPVSFYPNVPLECEIGHFRKHRNGQGPAGHTQGVAFTLVFRGQSTSGGTVSYQVDIPPEG